MAKNAVQSLKEKIETVKQSLYDDALMIEQQFNADQKRENKRASSDGMGLRMPKATITSTGIHCKWYKKKILASGQYSEQVYACPASGTYTVNKITSNSPLWEKGLVSEAEVRFTEIRLLSRKIFKLSKCLNLLSEYLERQDIVIEDLGIEINENAELGLYTLAVINDLFEQTDEILMQLFKKAVDLQSLYYEEWMLHASTHGKAVSGVFPTSRMNKNSLEIRWIKKVRAKDQADPFNVSYKKGKSDRYNTHLITQSLPDWGKRLVCSTEEKMEKLRTSSKCLHVVRRCAKDINQAINQSSMINARAA